MKIRCAWHIPPKIMGEKEPLEDKSVIDGICDSCLAKHFPNVADKASRLDVEERDRYPDYTIKESK